MSNIIAYYHIHLTDDPLIWSSIFLEQMKCMEDFGLSKHLDKMRITCIGQDDERIRMFLNLCKSYDIPMELTVVKNPFDNDRDMLYNRNTYKSCTEDITLQRIWQDCKTEDMKVLYFHSKGSTSYSLNVNPDSIVKHKEYFYWRSFMNWAVLEMWEHCVRALETHDVAGGDYHVTPSPHYCGNFWWATSNHIKQLRDPTIKQWWYDLQHKTDDAWIKQAPVRMYDEMWIGSRENIKACNLIALRGANPVNQCLSKLDYERLRV